MLGAGTLDWGWQLEAGGFNFKIFLKYSTGSRVWPGWEKGGNPCGSLYPLGNALLGFLGALSRSKLVNLSLVGVFFIPGMIPHPHLRAVLPVQAA